MRDAVGRLEPVQDQGIYATASIAGGVTYVILDGLGAPFALTFTLALLLTLSLRLAAIYWQLALPVFAWVEVYSTDASEDTNDQATEDDRAAERNDSPKGRIKMVRQRQPKRKPRS